MKFEIYRDTRSEYRWRLKAANGRIIADSGEGYVSKINAVTAAMRFKGGIAAARIVDFTVAVLSRTR